MTRKKRPTADQVISRLNATRRNNLRNMIGEGKRFATLAEMAIECEQSASYLTQLIGPNPIKRVTEVTARKLEYRLKIATNSLDRE